MSRLRRGFLALNRLAYDGLARRLLFRLPAQDAHRRLLALLAGLDASPVAGSTLGFSHRIAFENAPVEIGGARLSYPLIVAAGLVKGEGFESEAEAFDAVQGGRNIMPGWRSVPRLLGLVEFGSFTRHPRLGNLGTVVWRDAPTRSTQNRVGLKNPGAKAAAAFLARHRTELPPQFGLNVAASPGVDDPQQQAAELVESVSAILEAGICPTWLTLNLSCPNTDDDPGGHQTEAGARDLCSAVVERVHAHRASFPVWVKVSPGLADEQYRILMRVFHEVGVRAVIATNTLGRPAPDASGQMAGVGGGRLHAPALGAVRILADERTRRGYAVDVIGCGGVLDARSYQDFLDCGAGAVQYWSALVYRGPFAAAVIQDELNNARLGSAGRQGAAGN